MSGLKKYISKKLNYFTENNENIDYTRSPLQFLDEQDARRLRMLYGKAHIGLTTLEIRDFYHLPTGSSEIIGLQLLDCLEFEAVKLIPQFFHHAKVLFSMHVGFSSIVIFFEITDDFTAFANATHLFRLQVNERINVTLSASLPKPVDVLAGYSHIESWRRDNFDEVFFRAFCQAKGMAQKPKECDYLPMHDEFHWLLESERIDMHYQPVICFENGRVTGWEAFMRGPDGNFFHMPEMLFRYADENGQALRLDRLCRRMALRHLGPIEDHQYLFINVHPASLSDPNFTPKAVAQEVRDSGLTPENVVLEFTERQRMQDINYYSSTLQGFRHEGFHVAIDDVGTGQSSLRFIPQLRPDYVKVDVSLIGNIDSNPFHRIMVESLAYMSEKIGANVVAVGIETETELSSLVSMGIYGGQGNYISPPCMEKSTRNIAIPVHAAFSEEGIQALKCSLPISDLAKETISTDERTTVREVKAMLADKPPQTSVVVLRRNRPVGLLMQYSMDRHLSTQFGMSLYHHRDVGRIMDVSPLIVDASLPTEEVARKAMERESTKIYDDIIVISGEKLKGVVSVQRMLDSLAQTQVELAKGANPLSGLPGNVSIEKELENRAHKRIPTSLIYVDLDNFKVYNDVFGFERGDRIILLTAKVLAESVGARGDREDFVGHVGGDDFLILADPSRAESICQKALDDFAAQTPQLYRQEDLERGYIVGKGRDGKTSKFPLTSLSIAVIDCDFAPPFNMEMLSTRVADVKKAAKCVCGNSCVREALLANPSEIDYATDSNQPGAHLS